MAAGRRQHKRRVPRRFPFYSGPVLRPGTPRVCGRVCLNGRHARRRGCPDAVRGRLRPTRRPPGWPAAARLCGSLRAVSAPDAAATGRRGGGYGWTPAPPRWGSARSCRRALGTPLGRRRHRQRGGFIHQAQRTFVQRGSTRRRRLTAPRAGVEASLDLARGCLSVELGLDSPAGRIELRRHHERRSFRCPWPDQWCRGPPVVIDARLPHPMHATVPGVGLAALPVIEATVGHVWVAPSRPGPVHAVPAWRVG